MNNLQTENATRCLQAESARFFALFLLACQSVGINDLPDPTPDIPTVFYNGRIWELNARYPGFAYIIFRAFPMEPVNGKQVRPEFRVQVAFQGEGSAPESLFNDGNDEFWAAFTNPDSPEELTVCAYEAVRKLIERRLPAPDTLQRLAFFVSDREPYSIPALSLSLYATAHDAAAVVPALQGFARGLQSEVAKITNEVQGVQRRKEKSQRTSGGPLGYDYAAIKGTVFRADNDEVWEVKSEGVGSYVAAVPHPQSLENGRLLFKRGSVLHRRSAGVDYCVMDAPPGALNGYVLTVGGISVALQELRPDSDGATTVPISPAPVAAPYGIQPVIPDLATVQAARAGQPRSVPAYNVPVEGQYDIDAPLSTEEMDFAALVTSRNSRLSPSLAFQFLTSKPRVAFMIIERYNALMEQNAQKEASGKQPEAVDALEHQAVADVLRIYPIVMPTLAGFSNQIGDKERAERKKLERLLARHWNDALSDAQDYMRDHPATTLALLSRLDAAKPEGWASDDPERIEQWERDAVTAYFADVQKAAQAKAEGDSETPLNDVELSQVVDLLNQHANVDAGAARSFINQYPKWGRAFATNYNGDYRVSRDYQHPEHRKPIENIVSDALDATVKVHGPLVIVGLTPPPVPPDAKQEAESAEPNGLNTEGFWYKLAVVALADYWPATHGGAYNMLAQYPRNASGLIRELMKARPEGWKKPDGEPTVDGLEEWQKVVTKAYFGDANQPVPPPAPTLREMPSGPVADDSDSDAARQSLLSRLDKPKPLELALRELYEQVVPFLHFIKEEYAKSEPTILDQISARGAAPITPAMLLACQEARASLRTVYGEGYEIAGGNILPDALASLVDVPEDVMTGQKIAQRMNENRDKGARSGYPGSMNDGMTIYPASPEPEAAAPTASDPPAEMSSEPERAPVASLTAPGAPFPMATPPQRLLSDAEEAALTPNPGEQGLSGLLNAQDEENNRNNENNA